MDMIEILDIKIVMYNDSMMMTIEFENCIASLIGTYSRTGPAL